ncbi:MAG: hypothetical protein FWE84_01870 [Firmicutes bacterium]|nr:hypothetical protein [Bacillota bacterium]
MANEDILKKDFEFYLNNLLELENLYRGKHIVIKGCKVIGAYDTFDAAYNETIKSEEAGTFLIQLALTDKSAYTMTYPNSHIRV